jgi:hypothetical protein
MPDGGRGGLGNGTGAGGGGGGGGYFGGGGGGASTAESGGGGGGSSFVDASALDMTIAAGAGRQPGNAQDPDRIGNAGLGALPTLNSPGSDGADGLVVILPAP